MTQRTGDRKGLPTWIELSTSDPAASAGFYSQLFGWTATSLGEDYGHYTTFDLGGAPIAGAMPSQGGPDGWFTYLATDDVEAVAEAAAAAGGTVVVPPTDVMTLGRMTILADPGGASIGAWEARDHHGFARHLEPSTPGWFELHTRAYDASVAFYRDVFGAEVHPMSDTPELRYTTLGAPGAEEAGIMDATGFLPEGQPSGWNVYFSTSDADATAARAVELGATVVQGPDTTPYGRLVGLTDPTGAWFKLNQPPA
jgi:predicted enzyme related to lactoylglutathione lyase